MDEIDNEALSVLMILDDELFPQLLEWSASKGWSDLVIFLLETDYLRFKTNDMFESEPDKTGVYEPYYLIQKNAGGCFDKFFSPTQMQSLKRLIDSGIPLNSVYSQVCSLVWKEMLNRTDKITSSSIWPTVRKSIVENHEITLEDMLADVMKRKYFDRFIQGDACDLASLQCLLSVRRIFAMLSKYKEATRLEDGSPRRDSGSNSNISNGRSNSVGAAHTSTSSNIFSYFGGKSSEENPSIMRRWKTSKNAIVSASKALQAPFASSVHNTGSTNSAGTVQPASAVNNEYTDPFEAFRILLEGTRQLQKQFFPTSTNLNTSSNSAFNAHSVASPSAQSYGSTPRSVNSRESYDTSPAGRPKSTQMRNCSGISEALRMEIQSTLTVNASVRSREIETVDQAFAFACAHMLDKQLHALEQEMLSYISAIFAQFQHTDDYVLMVAQTRAMKCKRIVDYSTKLEFLYDRVRQQKVVSWKDSQTLGKVFIAYGRVNFEGGEDYEESESKGSPRGSEPPSPFSPVSSSQAGSTLYGDKDKDKVSEPNNVSATSGQGSSDGRGRFNPNVVAISLEIVVPHTTLLSPTTVGACAHRVTLYAGGKRRAARLRAAASLPAASSLPSQQTMQSALGSVVAAASKLNVRSFVGNILGNTASEGVQEAESCPADAPEGTSSPPRSPRSPMRRVGSVQFRLAGENAPVPMSVVVPVVDSQPGQELRRGDRTISVDSAENEDDTLSELPVMGIAGSIKMRNISSANDIGIGGGSSIFDDIVNSAPTSGSGKYNIGGSFFEELSTTDQGDEEGEEEERSSNGSLSDANSDSSSDYEGDVRHVFSSTDLDQLIFLEDTPRDLAPKSITAPGGSAVFRTMSRPASMRSFSRVGSNISLQTGITTITGHTSETPTTSYDPGVRKIVAVDLAKLDRTLHRDVLGTTRQLPANTAGDTQRPPPGGAKSAGKTVKTKHLVASMAVTLAGVFCDNDGFGRKLNAPVEESFTFTTDTKCLELLNDMLFSKRAVYMGSDRTEGYIQAFERVSSVFRQNSMLNTARPLFRVCVQIQSDVIAPTRAAALKQQLAQLNQQQSAGRGAAAASSPKLAPLHPSHAVHTVASRIPHSHVRIGVSYTQLFPQHAMISLLSTVAFTACETMISGGTGGRSAGSLGSGCEEKKMSPEASGGPDLVPLPLKLKYTDNFMEYVTPPVLNASSCTSAEKESIYELYLGTLPPQADDGEQTTLRGSTLCEPITRHIGLCDFSLSEMVTSLSTRLVLQILMLVLVDRPVLLVSSSSTLLSKVQAAIPRLIWPFRVDGTHVVRQILSSAELHRFVYRHDVPFVSETQQPIIRDKKLNRKTSSWREMITRFATNVGSSLSGGNNETGSPGSRSPRGSFTRQRKAGSSGDLLAGMLKRTASGTGSVLSSEEGDFKSGTNSPVAGLTLEIPSRAANSPNISVSKTYHRIVTPPSLQLPTPMYDSEFGDGDVNSEVQVDQHSCILGVDANAFYNAPLELREELDNIRIRGSAFTIIDIDTCVILNRRPDEFCEDEGEIPPRPLPSRLSDSELFRCSNFGIFRSLVKTLSQVHEHLSRSTRALLQPGDLSECDRLESEYLASRLAEKVVVTNREVEKAFYAFWSEMVLRALPKNIQHFSGPKVISCDIRAVLTELLHTVVASSASMDMGEDVEDMRLPSGEGDTSGRRRSQSMRSTGSASDASTSLTNPAAAEMDSTTAHYLTKQLPAALPNTAMFDNMNKLPFEEFLALFVEQVANHGETNMCYAFYKEFIADGSVVFKDFLVRHSTVLEKWSM